MQVSEDLMKHIISKYGTEPKAIVDAIKFYENINNKVAAGRKNISEARKNFDETCKQVEGDMNVLRKTCDHPIAYFHGDPSGNNDSYHQCDICGKEY